MNEWATDDASSSLTNQQKYPQAERQWTESSEHCSTSEELVPYHHQPQPKRSSHYVSRRYSLSSDPHFSSNATSHPIVTILEEDPADCDNTTCTDNTLVQHRQQQAQTTPDPATVPPIKEFIPKEQLAHQVKSQPYHKQIRSELELTASEPGILDRAASPLFLSYEEADSESLQSVDSFATDPHQPEEIEGVAQLHPSAYESASSEEFYYPDITSELGVSFEIMDSPSGRTRRPRHRDSIQNDGVVRESYRKMNTGSSGPTMISDSTYEHMAGGRRSPNTYQPPSSNRYMYKQQSAASHRDVHIEDSTTERYASYQTVVSPGVQHKYDDVIEELNVRQGKRASPCKLVQDSRVTIFADAEMQHHRRDAATQYSKEDAEGNPGTHYAVSALSFICCPIFSILALRASCKVKPLLKENDVLGARKYSKQSLCLSFVSLFLGMFIYTIVVYVGVKLVDTPLWNWF